MVDPGDYFEIGLCFHGHKCPAMPMGLRAGAAAMNALGVERSKDTELVVLIETGENHFATCFADGIQVITGCTFGKGNIHKLCYGKWGVTLIDKRMGRSVRVTPKAEVIHASKKTEFFQKYRMLGVPASRVPAEIIDPLVAHVMHVPESELFHIGEVTPYDWNDAVHSFDSFVCELCGEMTVEPYGRIRGERKVCIPCRERSVRKG